MPIRHDENTSKPQGGSMTDSQAESTFALPALPELREQKVFGRSIRYYDTGRGAPPLVLVHGVGGDADQWAFCLEALRASRRVIAVDLPGFGRSDKPAIDYRIGGYVEMLDRFLTELGIGRASLLGHSLGGWIVASFALAFPDRVDALVLNDSAGIDEGGIPIPVDLNVSTLANMRSVFEAMFYDKSLVKTELVELAYALHLERGDGATIRSVLQTLTDTREKLDGSLHRLRVPTLILWGENDAVTPMSMAHAFHRHIEGSWLSTIPECGHFPPLEKVDAFVRAVNEFLASRAPA
jgi:pimeloyl-ACP methyl ester carboxylesterase